MGRRSFTENTCLMQTSRSNFAALNARSSLTAWAVRGTTSGMLRTSRKVLVLEDQFTNPCPWTSSPCPVAALAMGLRGLSPPDFAQAPPPPEFCVKWCFCQWQLSLSAVTEGLATFAKKRVWRPGSALTRWGSLQRFPDPVVGLKGDGLWTDYAVSAFGAD